MAAQKYDVFISYRRDGGENFATILYERLTAKGYRVFQDVEEMNPGDFNTQLLDIIEGCTDFVVVCSGGALDRCANEGDWVRREIAHALQLGKNVVPVLLRNFAWPANLPEDLAELPNKAGVESLSGQAKTTAAAIDTLCGQFMRSRPVKRTKKMAVLGVAALLLVAALAVGGILLFGDSKKPEDLQAKLTEMGFTSSLVGDELEITTYGGAAKRLEIPEGVAHIGDKAFKENKTLEEIILPKGLTHIGSESFYLCSNLTSVVLPEELAVIGGSAFSLCSKLSSIKLPKGLTAIGDFAFSYCTALRIQIPENVAEIGAVAMVPCAAVSVDDANPYFCAENSILYNKDKTRLLQFPQIFTEDMQAIAQSVTEIADFAFCRSAIDFVTLPDGLLDIGRAAFSYCDNLETVVIPPSVKQIQTDAFGDCLILATVEIPASVTSGIHNGAFTGSSPTIRCAKGSYAESYAKTHGFPYEYI